MYICVFVFHIHIYAHTGACVVLDSHRVHSSNGSHAHMYIILHICILYVQVHMHICILYLHICILYLHICILYCTYVYYICKYICTYVYYIPMHICILYSQVHICIYCSCTFIYTHRCLRHGARIPAMNTMRGGGLGSSTIFKKFHEPYAPS